MYAFIKGILQDVDTDHIVIENNGIGYNVHIYSPDSMDLPDAGEAAYGAERGLLDQPFRTGCGSHRR